MNPQHPATPSPAARPVMGPPQQASSLSIRDVLTMVRQRVWLIVFVLIGSMIVGAGGYVVMRKFFPKFTSMGLIRCKMPVTPDILSGRELLPQAQIIALETQSKATYLKNEVFLDSVLQRAVVQETRWFKKRQDRPDKLLERMQESFGARPQRDSEYVLVSMTTQNPRESQTILNEILSEFQQDMEEMANGRLISQLKALNDQRDSMVDELGRLRERLDGLRTRAAVPGWETGRTVVGEELTVMNQEKMRLEYQLGQLEVEMQRLEELRQSGRLSSNVQFAIEQDSLVLGYRSRISGLEEELDRLLSPDRFGEDHREVAALKAMIASNERRLQERIDELRDQYTRAEQVNLETQMRNIQEQLVDVQTRYEEISNRQFDLDQKRAEYNTVADDIQTLTAQLAELDNRISALKVQRDDPERIRAEIATRANLPRQRSSPKAAVWLGGAFLVGLVLAAALVFLLEVLNDTVKSPTDVTRYFGMPPAGMIPDYEQEHGDDVEVALITSVYPQSVMSEFYRQFKTGLISSTPAERLQSILVTSCSGGCGKTTTATNLAIVMATEGRRVLLVDANFRRPALKGIFSVNHDRGLSDVLEKGAQIEDVLEHTDVEGLDVICSGAAPSNPTHTLNAPEMREFIAAVKQRYDHVIFDGPPSLVVTDARVLAGMLDSVLTVVNAAETSRGIVSRMLREMRSVNAGILGILLNRVRPRRGGYLQESYQRYYEYIGGPAVAMRR